MTTGAALLAALDAALPHEDGPLPGAAEVELHRAGLSAAIGLNELLIEWGLGWQDVVIPAGGRLALLCGRLGSAYEAEQEAAYLHAVRLIRRLGGPWSRLVHLPEGVAGAPAAIALQASVLPPEEDWPSTVASLLSRNAWRSEAEHGLLEALGPRLAAGKAPTAEEARRLRDMWWSAELNAPEPVSE